MNTPMTTEQAFRYKKRIGAEVVERSTNPFGQIVWSFYAANSRLMDIKSGLDDTPGEGY